MTTSLWLSACSGGPSADDPPVPVETRASDAQGAEAAAPAAPVKRVLAPSRAGCDVVPVFAAGEAAGSVCSEDAAREGLTVVDLSDAWTPRVFVPGGDKSTAPEYRAKYLELASQPSGDLGLHGVPPNVSILAKRLTDDKRRACAADVQRTPLTEVQAEVGRAADDRSRAEALKKAESKAPLGVIQAELACAGLLKPSAATGRLGQTTHAALEAFRRRNMIIGAGLDADTVHALSLGGEEVAFRALLRGLRERVADAAGLLEDGSASQKSALVVGRELDLTRFAPLGAEAIGGGAPDLVDEATDAAARELGWTSPEAARAFLAPRAADLRGLRVAVRLPAAPAYHSGAMDLRVEIDRGDVFYDAPGEAAAARRKLGPPRGASFVVYARHEGQDIPLMRWATTIGGWKKDRSEDGEITLKYKASDVGDRVWRQVIAAPAWMPPDSTPELDLLHEDKDGNVSLKRDLIQPGYRNAYGLVMLIHEEPVVRGDKTTWADHGIRTHGSVDYRSIKRGTSHGCHRLHNQLALRLSGFLLQHRQHVRRGKLRTEYRRTLEWNEQSIEFDVPTRGYLYELDPPVPVRVLEGRVLGGADKPLSLAIPIEPAAKQG